MTVLQAAFEGGTLLLWGETPPVASSSIGSRSRQPKFPRPRPFPYDPGHEQLLQLLTGVVNFEKAPSTAAGKAFAWLPTVKNRPVPSTPLIAEVAETSAAVLAPWSLSVLRLSPEQAIDLLCACADRETLAAGVIVGVTLTYWSRALRFAAALVAREQFLPEMEEGDKEWRAVWRPILAGESAIHGHQLAQAMPPACRALTTNADAPPEGAPDQVLGVFLRSMVDVLVRSSLEGRATAVKPGRRPIRQPAKTFDSIHDQWLHALRAPDGLLTGKPIELGQFAEQVRTWQQPVAVATGAAFRLCFRLEEPPANGDEHVAVLPRGDWQVRYLLQAADDPSLLLPVSEAWSPRGRHAALFQSRGFNAREYLLTTLGQAAGICQPIESSLKTAAPGGYITDGSGAHAFLTEMAWMLEQAGFGVLLPAWWTQHGTRKRLSVRARVKSPKMQGGKWAVARRRSSTSTGRWPWATRC